MWLVPSLLRPKQAFFFAVLWITALSIVAPFAADEATRFRSGALRATAAWLAALVVLPGVATVIAGRGPGEDAMALFFPFVLFPALLLLVGVVRVLRQLLQRRGDRGSP